MILKLQGGWMKLQQQIISVTVWLSLMWCIRLAIVEFCISLPISPQSISAYSRYTATKTQKQDRNEDKELARDTITRVWLQSTDLLL